MTELMLNSETDRVYVSIVHYNSLTTHSPLIIKKSLSSLLQQNKFTLGQNLFVRICDNGSRDQTKNYLAELVAGQELELQHNFENLGFSAAHNQSVYQFLNSNCNYLLILNPDLALAPNALEELLTGLRKFPEAGLAGGKLFRGDDRLEIVNPVRLDSAGMLLNSSLRHLDRGSEQLDQGTFEQAEYVFGITGACLLISKVAVQRLLLPVNPYQAKLYQIYPQLEAGYKERSELFDESFYAYREDADLCWRANNLGIKSVYLPKAQGVHCRVVLSNNRQQLDPELNYLGVRNRFLLQINNYHFKQMPKAFFTGIIIRNLLVLFASFTIERSSFRAWKDLSKLFLRAWSNRQYLLTKNHD